MSYCRTHGHYDDYFDRGCPACSAAEERAEADREEMRDSLAAIAHAKANPGDYLCPHCKYVSLKEDASRCPLCHGEIKDEYWTAVLSKKAADAQRAQIAARAQAERQKQAQAAAAAECARTAPEREAAAVRSQIASVEAEIARCWKTIGYSVGSLVGLFLLALGSSQIANQHVDTSRPSAGGCVQIILGAVGSLGTIIFGLGVYAGAVIVAVIVLVQLVHIVVRKARIASLAAGSPRRPRDEI